jgi:endonuclease YncB( thermonuclease family)
VVGVADGDTLTVLDQKHEQHKVRLAGIDAPEKSQPFGQRAKQSLSKLAYGHSVSVEWRKRDRYRRIVGKVFEGGRDVNLEQVRRGLAWHYKQDQNEQGTLDRARYATAESEERAARRGLWALPAAQRVPPWEWRHGGKQPAQAAPAERTAVASGPKRYCREMVSCEDRHYLSACGLTRLDSDSDGIPCDALC